MFEKIVFALTNKNFKSSPAILKDFQRHAIITQDEPASYPAMKKSPNSTVEGKILFNLTDQALKVIEYYENNPPAYKKKSIQVTTPSHEIYTAYTYVALPHLHPNLKGHWNPEHFEKHHLQDYVQIHIPQMLKDMES